MMENVQVGLITGGIIFLLMIMAFSIMDLLSNRKVSEAEQESPPSNPTQAEKDELMDIHIRQHQERQMYEDQYLNHGFPKPVFEFTVRAPRPQELIIPNLKARNKRNYTRRGNHI